jgi:hypothetical protein
MSGYYVGDEPTEIYFKVGMRKNKKRDELAARAVDADNATVLVDQLNVYYDCQCGAAAELEKDLLGEDSETADASA